MRANREPASALSPEELSAFARGCIELANTVADEHGFVPIRDLLKRFRARLIIRPLLVEGMLAPLPGEDGWAVLVDSETYAVTESDVAQEYTDAPLPSRLRFTVAHELAHSLAFRPSEFGIRLRSTVNTEDSKKAVVAAIERVTDRLAPLLLVPENKLTSFCRSVSQPSVRDFAEFRRRAGVSREVLINRLRLLSNANTAALRDLCALNNVAICLGEWLDSRVAALRSWPVFFNFERNIVPEFLLKLLHQDRLLVRAVFDREILAPRGVQHQDIQLTVAAGTASVPDAEQMSVRCSLEAISPEAGSKFLVFVRKSS